MKLKCINNTIEEFDSEGKSVIKKYTGLTEGKIYECAAMGYPSDYRVMIYNDDGVWTLVDIYRFKPIEDKEAGK